MSSCPHPRSSRASSEEGFALVGLVVAIFIILLTLSVAAPTVARALRREREVEAMHRANEYVNAIRRYHIKTGAYPGTIEQLEKANNIRYLRQRYNDPMTGKPDWRLIKVGENKTTVKGFFGQPLAGLNTSSAGSSPTSPSSIGSTPNSTSGSGIGSQTPLSDSSMNNSASPSSAVSSSTGSSFAGGSNASTAGATGSPSGIGSAGSGAPFMGVGLPSPGTSIATVNEKTTYPEWEFLYDPRIEQMKAKVNIFGGGMSSTSSSSLGSLSNSASPNQSSPGQTTPSSGPSTGSGGAPAGSTTPQ